MSTTGRPRPARGGEPPAGGHEGGGLTALPKRTPSPVPRGPRPRPGLFGPKEPEPGPIAALRRAQRAAVPLERVRSALQDLDAHTGRTTRPTDEHGSE
ncbi:hypothetical protein [Nocardiopsis sp. HUAS JQ3]|uniref:hypothetical protein n=1 Tax=Nocardiopsis sp. HUAS JQ3 TaxID=3061629 RepID=UPI0023A922FD|nr:hypothetical protein [Nocardiopsis sp. HUAS JQ3]WDZ93277.1 hypothetical protein PV789_12395 [Nocardiopsis sp. HUAS JQ3]